MFVTANCIWNRKKNNPGDINSDPRLTERRRPVQREPIYTAYARLQNDTNEESLIKGT